MPSPSPQPAATPAPPAKPPAPSIPTAQWRALGGTREPRKLPRGLDALWHAGEGKARGLNPRRLRYLRRARRVVRLREKLAQESDERLHETALSLREVFRLGREKAEDLDRAFALVSETARRRLGLCPFVEQVAGAFALHAGCVTEMATGEGKTLTAALPAAVAGWRGRGCHLITVNDYLAQRDAQWMAPVYRFCGLRVAHVDEQMEPDARRRAYAADVTYCTNKQVTADFLRDRLVLGRRRGLSSTLLEGIEGEADNGLDTLVMRGLACAIVDEADSILIDEAVTPLIISGQAPNAEQTEAFEQAARIAASLEPRRHYRVNHRWREVRLTPEGQQRVRTDATDLGGVWSGKRRREELVTQALTARELYLLDHHYVIREGKVVIVDESTGRLMPDRTWRHGLHQAVEAKEGLEIQPPQQTLARISFQRFFRLYQRLCGMTGTAWESRAELWQNYRLPVVRIPTHRPCVRRRHPDRIHRTAEARWRAVVEQTLAHHRRGRPVLIGTRSVQASEHLSQLLREAGLEHQVLNAVRHTEEAQIVARAGGRGRITVATNMAGRGTDIKLGHGVAELGGLHVIATERHESARVDRQLFGRAGRQGDPGSAQAVTSLEDELCRRHAAAGVRTALRGLTLRSGRCAPLAPLALRLAQYRAGRAARRQRRGVLRSDHWLDEHLAFAGEDM